ncbi:integrase family protein [Pseudogulbenkiania sp. MAI-1]|uniref:tyrosine-type recombinase/integrase n=1 Tax=Pseudogulbenkiania sp. MAI-1 TaxID=990370 RepID=UPI0004AE2F89|nr:integrase family protein [Pseudogulbenkiania sp. MAI-1]
MAKKSLLDVATIKNAVCPEGKGVDYLNDGGGLRVAVRRNSKTFVFRYNGKTLTLGEADKKTLGGKGALTLAEARAKADALRPSVRGGGNPIDAKREQDERQRQEEAERLAKAETERREREAAERLEAAKLTMNQLFDEWDTHHGATLDPHWRAVRQSHWRVHLEPLFGSHKVASATRQQAMKLYDRMVKEGKEATARKVLALLKQVMHWAVERDHAAPNHELLHASPPKPKRRVTDDQLPENFDIEAHLAKHGESVIGDDGEDDLAGRALQFGELVMLLSERLPASTQAESGKRLIKLLLATGLRGVEGTRLRWNWISLERRLMIVPAGAAKKRRQLHIHLSDYALEQLRFMADFRIAGNDHVFPAPEAVGKSIRRDNVGNDVAARQFYDLPDESPEARAARLAKRLKYKRATKDMTRYNLPGGKWTFYDLRRTAATRLEELGISRDIVARVLNHARPDAKTTGRYARYANWEARCKALDLLGSALADCEAGQLPAVVDSNVVPMFRTA